MRREAILDFFAGIVNDNGCSNDFLYCLVLQLMQCPAIVFECPFKKIQQRIT
jgi:hypothetical protein